MESIAGRCAGLFSCPECGSDLRVVPRGRPSPAGLADLQCASCSASFPLVNNVPFFLSPWATDQKSPLPPADAMQALRPPVDLASYVRLLDRASSPGLDVPGLWDRAIACSGAKGADRQIRSDPSVASWDVRARVIDAYVVERALSLIDTGAIVLDICTGGGSAACEIARRAPSCRLIGVDKCVSFPDVNAGAWNTDGGPVMACADVRALPLRQESVDLVIDANGLAHVVDAELAVGKIARVVKAGGYVLVVAPASITNPAELELREQVGGSLGYPWVAEHYVTAGFELLETVRVSGKEHGLPETYGGVFRKPSAG